MARSSAAKAPTPQRDLQKDMAAAAALKEQLKNILGESEVDAVLLKDSIEGETSLFETIDAVLGQIGLDASRIEGIDAFAKALAGRKARLVKREETLRAMLTNCLDILEEKKLERPLATVTLKDLPPKLVVVDESKIPSAYFDTGDPVLQKAELTDALKARDEAIAKLEAEREAAEVPDDSPVYREKLAAILAEHPPIPGAELSNGSVAVQIRFS